MNNVEKGYECVKNIGFSDKNIRRGFIRKVYGILLCQLSVTVVIVSVCTFHEDTKAFFHSNPIIWGISFIISFVTLMVMAYCDVMRRKPPMNYICLSIFTFANSFLLGCGTSTFKKEEVFYAVVITLVVTVGLTMFALQPKVDFTVFGGILVVALFILILFGIAWMVYPVQTLKMVYAFLVAFVYSIFIICDTQLMIGGDHKYSISPEEYVFASLNLYLDIVNLFIYILRLYYGGGEGCAS